MPEMLDRLGPSSSEIRADAFGHGRHVLGPHARNIDSSGIRHVDAVFGPELQDVFGRDRQQGEHAFLGAHLGELRKKSTKGLSGRTADFRYWGQNKISAKSYAKRICPYFQQFAVCAE
ncbi:hypothetical protein [Rhizobium sp. No.120]